MARLRACGKERYCDALSIHRVTRFLCGLPRDRDRHPCVRTGMDTSGVSILTPSGQRYVIAGVNWYGFETRNSVAHGMWTKDYKAILNLMKANGRAPVDD